MGSDQTPAKIPNILNLKIQNSFSSDIVQLSLLY